MTTTTKNRVRRALKPWWAKLILVAALAGELACKNALGELQRKGRSHVGPFALGELEHRPIR